MPMRDRDWYVDPLREDPAPPAPTTPPGNAVRHDPRTWEDVFWHALRLVLIVAVVAGIILALVHGHTGTIG